MTLTITDNNSPAETDTITHQVSVNQGNRPPVANPGGPYTVGEGGSVILNGRNSTDPDAVIHSSNQLFDGLPIEGANLAPLTTQQVQPIEQEAIHLWVAAGARPGSFKDVTIQIVDLPSSGLGLAAADTIWLDKDAAGHGWFIDPSGTTELNPSYAAGKVDLLTVMAHELGHILGYEDTGTTGLMAEYLSTDVRRLPTMDQFGGSGSGNSNVELPSSAKSNEPPLVLLTMAGSANALVGRVGIVASVVASVAPAPGQYPAAAGKKASGWIQLQPHERGKTSPKQALDAVSANLTESRLSTIVGDGLA